MTNQNMTNTTSHEEVLNHYEDVLTTKQATEKYPFIPEATWRWWRHNGTGPASFVIGKKVLYRRSEIDRWLAEQEQATTRGGAA